MGSKRLPPILNLEKVLSHTLRISFINQHLFYQTTTRTLDRMIMTRRLLFPLLLLANVVHSFVIHHHQPAQKAAQRTLLHTSMGSSSSMTETVELWLDLRGTKLTSGQAMDRLEQDLGRTEKFVDRILVDNNEQQHLNNNDRTIVVVDNTNDRLQGPLEGICVKMPASGILLDPMPAMDAVSSGEWVLIQSELAGDTQKRHEGITSLLQLLAGSSALGGGADSVLGSVAWSCGTKADILHAGMTVQSLQRVDSTLGGILLSSSSVDSSAAPPLQCALMLPFDEILWQTALKFFREQETEEEAANIE